MNFAAVRQLYIVFKWFRNPWSLILDRLNWKNSPYVAITRSGTRLNIRAQTGDRYTVFETFGLGVYDRGISALCEGDAVIDVGANIGAFALRAAERVGPGGIVIAVEPEQATFDQLCSNIEANALGQIKAHRIATGGQEREIEIIVPGPDTLFTSMFAKVDGRAMTGTRQKVRCVTLDGLMAKHKLEWVNLLKLDCEGAEHEIISQLTEKPPRESVG